MDEEEEKGSKGEEGLCDTWCHKHRPMWVGATSHPFILSISDGTIHISAFKTWLGQDYIFVKNLVPFVASLIVKAWKESDESSNDMEVILSGLTSLKEELEWFKREAKKWGVNLSQTIVPHKQNQLYCRFLDSLMSPNTEYTVAIVAFWAIETVYQTSFASCLEEGSKTPTELKETCQRWGNKVFSEYCNALKAIADRRLKTSSTDVISKVELVFKAVLEHEVEFWNMSLGEF